MPIVEVLARYRDRRDLHTQPAVIVHIDIIDINRAQSTRIQPSQPQTEPPPITRPSRQTTSTWCGPTAVSCQTTTCCRPRAHRAAFLRRPHSTPSRPSMSSCESRPCACACCNLPSRIFDADQHTAQTHASVRNEIHTYAGRRSLQSFFLLRCQTKVNSFVIAFQSVCTMR